MNQLPDLSLKGFTEMGLIRHGWNKSNGAILNQVNGKGLIQSISFQRSFNASRHLVLCWESRRKTPVLRIVHLSS